jgi:hypothetical protein
MMFPPSVSGAVKLRNAAGTTINPATADRQDTQITSLQKIDDLQGALKSVDTDELVVRVVNTAGTEINPAKEDGNLADAATAVKGQRSSGASGQVTVGTSNITLPSNVVAPGCKVTIWADADNTGEVAINIGAAAVVGTHAGLKKGQGIELAVSNTNLINLIGSAAGQKINWVVET